MSGPFARAYATATSEDSTIRFCTSWLLSPLAFAIWRALVSLYAFVVIFVILGHTSGTVYPGRSFSYFTVLGYWGLAFYYAFAAVHAGSFWYRGGRSFLSGWPTWLRWAHGCFYSSVTTFPFVVTSRSFPSYSFLPPPVLLLVFNLCLFLPIYLHSLSLYRWLGTRDRIMQRTSADLSPSQSSSGAFSPTAP